MMSENKGTLLSIHYLRGIACLAVVFFHYRGLLNHTYAQQNLGDLLFEGGYFGVDIFFMLSGFVIVLSTTKDFSPLNFTIRRMFRLYPVYIVCLLIFSFVYFYNNPVDIRLIKAALLLPFDFNAEAPYYGFSLIYTAWTLTYEICFYFLFLISMSLSGRYRSLLCSALILLVVYSSNAYVNGSLSFSSQATLNFEAKNSLQGIIKIFASPMLFEFVYGMVLCEIYIKLKDMNFNATSLANFMLVIGISFSVFSFGSRYNGGHGIVNVGVHCMILMFVMVFYEMVRGMSEIKPLMFLGNISYSLYLVHPMLMDTLYTPGFSFPPFEFATGFSKFLLALTMAIALSYLLYICVEKPSMTLARKFIKHMKKD
jgi:peptidoglycan/LPS O-acetylase OafA/YrhL